MAGLPAGFVMDASAPQSAGPPAGFVLDSQSPKTGMAGVGEEIANRFNNPQDASLIGAAGGLYRAGKQFLGDASSLGEGKVDLYSPQGADKAVGVAAGVLPMSPASTVGRTILAPTNSALHSTASAGYDSLRSSDLRMRPDAVAGAADSIRSGMEGQGFRSYNPDQAPIFSAVDELKNLGQPASGIGPPRPVSGADLEAVRQVLNKTPFDKMGKGGGAGYAASGAAKEGIDDFVRDMPSSAVVAGDPAAFKATSEEARGNYAGARRSDQMQGAVDFAERQTEGNAGNKTAVDNPIRKRANSILNQGSYSNGELRVPGMSAEDVANLRHVVKGTLGSDITERVGQLDPTRGVVRAGLMGAAGEAAWHSGSPEAMTAAVAAPAIGYLSRKMGDLLTRNRMNAADEATRMQTPLASQPFPGRSTQSAMTPVGAMMLGLGANAARNRE